jgi:hypothetical protein
VPLPVTPLELLVLVAPPVLELAAPRVPLLVLVAPPVLLVWLLVLVSAPVLALVEGPAGSPDVMPHRTLQPAVVAVTIDETQNGQCRDGRLRMVAR